MLLKTTRAYVVNSMGEGRNEPPPPHTHTGCTTTGPYAGIIDPDFIGSEIITAAPIHELYVRYRPNKIGTIL